MDDFLKHMEAYTDKYKEVLGEDDLKQGIEEGHLECFYIRVEVKGDKIFAKELLMLLFQYGFDGMLSEGKLRFGKMPRGVMEDGRFVCALIRPTKAAAMANAGFGEGKRFKATVFEMKDLEKDLLSLFNKHKVIDFSIEVQDFTFDKKKNEMKLLYKSDQPADGLKKKLRCRNAILIRKF